MEEYVSAVHRCWWSTEEEEGEEEEEEEMVEAINRLIDHSSFIGVKETRCEDARKTPEQHRLPSVVQSLLLLQHAIWPLTFEFNLNYVKGVQVTGFNHGPARLLRWLLPRLLLIIS